MNLFCKLTPSSRFFSSARLLLSQLTVLRLHHTIFYIFLVFCPIPLCQFFHLPSSTEVQVPPPLLLSPTLLSLCFFFHARVSLFSFTLQERRRRVIYEFVGNTSTEGKSRPFQGSIFLLPSGADGRELSTAVWPFPSPSEATVCVSVYFRMC